MSKLKSADALEAYRAKTLSKRKPGAPSIAVCGETGCRAQKSLPLIEAFREELAARGLASKVRLLKTGCHGFCQMGPVAVVQPQGIFYPKLKPKDVRAVIEETIVKGVPAVELLYSPNGGAKKIALEKDVPFYSKQQRLIFGQNSSIDPEEIDDYIAAGGYSALAKALSKMNPGAVTDEIKKSGLRGRGGAGFPTGEKWASCRKAKSPDGVRYIVCNADEGDPGAFMDRSLIEGNPHSVLEGMIIGAYAVGAREGYFYVRHEYPHAVTILSVAIKQARSLGLIGENILGSGFSFDVRIIRGGGAFVCGESSALMVSLEGKPGEPRAKYIRSVEKGLFEKPTVLNNVETWANVPLIINKGAKWYSGIGASGSKGTKLFSLVGKITNTGLVEVPMGTALREIIFGIGGGIPNGKKFKAVQTGGPSGGCLPKSKLDLPVDFDALAAAGSMMGSGGMIVMDEDTCMVEVARYFLDFLQGESCGKCLPCREGIKQMLDIVTRITEGEGRKGDIELLEELGEVVRDTSLCGLGQTAANPLLSTIRYFRNEYEAHINEKKCPAAVCRKLITYSIDKRACTGCGACLAVCPSDCISGKAKTPYMIDASLCVACGSCESACKYDAVVRG